MRLVQCWYCGEAAWGLHTAVRAVGSPASGPAGPGPARVPVCDRCWASLPGALLEPAAADDDDEGAPAAGAAGAPKVRDKLTGLYHTVRGLAARWC